MKKTLIGLAAAAALAAPLAVAGTANAAPAPAKATGTVTWAYAPNHSTGTVVFHANDKTGGTLDYTDSNGQTLHGVVTQSTVAKTGNTITFQGTIADADTSVPSLAGDFTAVVIDGGTSGRNGDQIGLFVNRPVDGVLADVTSGNLTVF